MMRDGQQLRLWCHVAHVRVVGDGHFSALLRGDHHRIRGGVERQHIGLLVHQGHGGFAFARRVKPGVDPNQLDLRFRVDRLHAQRECVNALNHFGNRKTGHITGDAGFADTGSGDAGQKPAFVIAGVGSGHVGRCFIAGDGFEFHVREFSRYFHGRFHVAEAGREYQAVALLRHVADDAFGVSAFGHVINKTGLHLQTLLLHGLL